MKRVTYANVVASLALFVAIGGSSYAAISVTGAQVRDGSLTGRDVHNGTLTGRDVRDRSLLAADFAPGQLPAGTAGPAGPQGPKGDAGATGAAGPRGDPGTADVHKVEQTFVLAASETSFPSVECASGERATGGGVQSANDVRVTLDAPETNADSDAPVGWAAGFINESNQDRKVFVSVICG